MSPEEKTSLLVGSRRCMIIAVIDFLVAVYCAAVGNSHFVAFMILAGLMWAFGMRLKAEADLEQGE